MNDYVYRIYHNEDHCTRHDLIRPTLTEKLLDHEYENLSTALRLFSRVRNPDVTFNTSRSTESGVLVTLHGLTSEHEADNFIGEFSSWLSERTPNRFCPAVDKASL